MRTLSSTLDGIGRCIARRPDFPTASANAAVAKTTYFEPGNQWYLPTMVGPSTFVDDVRGGAAVREALAVLERLSPDAYLDYVTRFYREGLERFGDRWAYADINTVLLGLSRAIGAKSYLEIGVRRGRSMAMVAAYAPTCDIVGFDLWIQNYAGMENPGPSHVEGELRQLGFAGKLEFIDGDSRVTVPTYFREHPDRLFDLMTVDGDHSVAGARADLENVMPRVKVGGALVFDDISNQSHAGLAALWDELVARNPRFSTYAFDEVGFGVGFAIRKY